VYSNKEIQGPYSKSEITRRIQDRSINSTAKIFFDGGDWLPIAEVFPSYFGNSKAASIEPATVKPIPRNPNLTPREDLSRSNFTETRNPGGIGRIGFGVAAFATLLVGSYLAAITAPFSVAGIFVGLTLMIPVRSRLRNIGYNPNWCFLSLIPVASLVVTIACLQLPPGYKHDRKFDLAAKIIRWILVGILVILFFAVMSVMGPL
jgi:hypothetical protein